MAAHPNQIDAAPSLARPDFVNTEARKTEREQNSSPALRRLNYESELSSPEAARSDS